MFCDPVYSRVELTRAFVPFIVILTRNSQPGMDVPVPVNDTVVKVVLELIEGVVEIELMTEEDE